MKLLELKQQTLLFFLLLCLTAISCESNPEKDSNENYKKLKKEVKFQGDWILVEYFEPILQEKRIGKYRSVVPALTAFHLTIDENNLMKTLGLLSFSYSNHVKVINNHDSICSIEALGGAGKMTLSYDDKNDQLIIKAIDDWEGYFKGQPTIFHYKRSDELSDLKHMDEFSEYLDILQKYFQQKLIVGEYKVTYPKEFEDLEIIFHKNGSVEGFGEYQIYALHVFYGTFHPTGYEDKIVFYKDHYKHPNSSYDYNWKIEGNQLIFYEFSEIDLSKMRYTVENKAWVLEKISD